MSSKPAWWNLFLGVLSLVASFVWPYIESLLPPFGPEIWGQIVTWLVEAIFIAIFGWNAKVASVKQAIANQRPIYGYRLVRQ